MLIRNTNIRKLGCKLKSIFKGVPGLWLVAVIIGQFLDGCAYKEVKAGLICAGPIRLVYIMLLSRIAID